MVRATIGCVYVACAKEDVADAEGLSGWLEQSGFPVWRDWRDLGRSGDAAVYTAAIFDSTTACSAFVLLLSNRSGDLTSVGELTSIVDSMNKPIIAVRLSEHAPVPPFPELARARAWIDLSEARRADELPRLAAELHAARANQPAPAQSAHARPPAQPANAPAFAAPASRPQPWSPPAPPAQTPPAPPPRSNWAPPVQVPQSIWSNRVPGAKPQPLWMRIVFIVLGVTAIIIGLLRIFGA